MPRGKFQKGMRRIRENKAAVIIFEAGPAMDIRAASLRGFLRLYGSKGTF